MKFTKDFLQKLKKVSPSQIIYPATFSVIAVAAVIFLALTARFFSDTINRAIAPAVETTESLPMPLDVATLLRVTETLNVDIEIDADARRKNDLAELAAALDAYVDAYGVYPSTDDSLRNVADTLCPELIEDGRISACLEDPSGLPAFYGYKSDGATYYELTAVLDDPECSGVGTKREGDICLYRIQRARLFSEPDASLGPLALRPR